MTTGNVRAADSELIERCRRGDVDAFEELYRAQSGRLFNLAYRMCGNAADAEDLLQEMFLTGFRKLAQFRGQAALSTWLYRLGVNVCVDYLRSRANKMQQATDSLDDDERRGASVPRAIPESPLGRLELERAIARLPPGCRAAFVLHDVEGFQHQEIAVMLGIASGTSKSQVHKARMKLRALLSQPAAYETT
jgi:RNA polymerase sigma-70 factor (ECF subfamily)